MGEYEELRSHIQFINDPASAKIREWVAQSQGGAVASSKRILRGPDSRKPRINLWIPPGCPPASTEAGNICIYGMPDNCQSATNTPIKTDYLNPVPCWADYQLTGVVTVNPQRLGVTAGISSCQQLTIPPSRNEFPEDVTNRLPEALLPVNSTKVKDEQIAGFVLTDSCQSALNRPMKNECTELSDCSITVNTSNIKDEPTAECDTVSPCFYRTTSVTVKTESSADPTTVASGGRPHSSVANYCSTSEEWAEQTPTAFLLQTEDAYMDVVVKDEPTHESTDEANSPVVAQSIPVSGVVSGNRRRAKNNVGTVFDCVVKQLNRRKNSEACRKVREKKRLEKLARLEALAREEERNKRLKEELSQLQQFVEQQYAVEFPKIRQILFPWVQ